LLFSHIAVVLKVNFTYKTGFSATRSVIPSVRIPTPEMYTRLHLIII